ncbi:MAG: hypothetical protein WC699_05610 [Bacteroidales bacterium]|jgi:hypothetical protein
MKNLKRIASLVLCTGFLLCATSCAVFVTPGQNRGQHRGWFKQSYSQGHPGRINQGNQGKAFRQSDAVNPPGKSNKGKHKGNYKK